MGQCCPDISRFQERKVRHDFRLAGTSGEHFKNIDNAHPGAGDNRPAAADFRVDDDALLGHGHSFACRAGFGKGQMSCRADALAALTALLAVDSPLRSIGPRAMFPTIRSHIVALLATAVALAAGPAVSQSVAEPPKHGAPPPFFNSVTPEQGAYYAAGGTSFEHHRDPAQELAEARLLNAQLAALAPQRKGVVDAYVVSVALDSDGVFAREAREAGRVLSARYGAQGRSITLAGPDGRGGPLLARGSPAHLDMVLARLAELIDPGEDVLILYTTSHGAPFGIVYNYGDEGWGVLSPARLDAVFDRLGIRRRVLMISACFSGIFVPALATGDTAILTASTGDRTSFGCQADSDWTFFGDALINQALRKPQPLAEAGKEAAALIDGWEARGKLTPSLPQTLIGARAEAWLRQLDARAPKVPSAPVGRPAVSLLER